MTTKIQIAIFCGFNILFVLACQTNSEVKKNQYFAEGLALYKVHCANCHQLDGTGLEGLYPPISADILKKNGRQVICWMQNGLNDSLIVNGKKYTQKMPANPNLQPLELAELATFIQNKWGGSEVVTDIEEVKLALESCKK